MASALSPLPARHMLGFGFGGAQAEPPQPSRCSCVGAKRSKAVAGLGACTVPARTDCCLLPYPTLGVWGAGGTLLTPKSRMKVKSLSHLLSPGPMEVRGLVSPAQGLHLSRDPSRCCLFRAGVRPGMWSQCRRAAATGPGSGRRCCPTPQEATGIWVRGTWVTAVGHALTPHASAPAWLGQPATGAGWACPHLCRGRGRQQGSSPVITPCCAPATLFLEQACH